MVTSCLQVGTFPGHPLVSLCSAAYGFEPLVLQVRKLRTLLQNLQLLISNFGNKNAALGNSGSGIF